MNYLIRFYTHKDFEMLSDWWKTSKELGPTKEMLPLDSTFICEYQTKPVLAITAYLTNCKEVAYLENFIGNPEFKNSIRTKLSHTLVEHVCNFVKDKGYNHVVCFSHKVPLVKHYQQLGMTKTLENLTGFGRKL